MITSPPGYIHESRVRIMRDWGTRGRFLSSWSPRYYFLSWSTDSFRLTTEFCLVSPVVVRAHRGTSSVTEVWGVEGRGQRKASKGSHFPRSSEPCGCAPGENTGWGVDATMLRGDGCRGIVSAMCDKPGHLRESH